VSRLNQKVRKANPVVLLKIILKVLHLSQNLQAHKANPVVLLKIILNPVALKVIQAVLQLRMSILSMQNVIYLQRV